MRTSNTIERARELSPAKRELLEKRLRGGFKPAASEPAIPLRAGNDPAPLSFSQQRLWLINQIEPASDGYNLPVVLRLTGEIDPGTLEKSLNEIVRRHEVLRATFLSERGEMVQVISPFQHQVLPVTDLRAGSPAEQEARARAAISEEEHRPFDLARGPLVRWRLLRMAEREHVLVLNMHHIVSDGWSVSVFLNELQTLYQGLKSGDANPLPPLPLQYADFSAWQQRSMEGPVLQEHVSYWKSKLSGAPSSLPLPHTTRNTQRPTRNRPRPAGAETIPLSKEFVSALSAFSQQHGASPFIAMLTALTIVLSKWARQDDLVIGTVVAGRTRRELETLIGCFINFLPLRASISGNPTLLEFLGEVRATVLEAYAHQDCPFEKIVEAVHPARKTPQKSPLYNVAFLMQNFPQGDRRDGPFAVRFLPTESRAALLDLRFLAEETDEGLALICEYDTQLFAAETITLLMRSFHQTLDTIVHNPGKRLVECEIDRGLVPQDAVLPQPIEQQIAVTATFTAEPLADSLRFWTEKLELPVEIQFAPYNQVFQQLLDPASRLRSNQQGMNVVLIRFEDWERFDSGPKLSREQKLEQQVSELTRALKAAASGSRTPWLVCVCPASRGAYVSGSTAAFLARMERKLAEELARVSGVYPVTSHELGTLYPVADYDDPHRDELGHVPYTPMFFAALGTLIIRKFHALKRAAKKVIVLDCDQTLWTGVCGEDGPGGVRIDSPRRLLHEFMLAQRDAGMLLCLCSKNSEEDVRAVFECCPNMPLRLEHFAASRINWRPKSENLRSLAEELKLGLDSFVLVDDNPLECAEVEANCPEVLTLQLPEDPELIPRVLNHAWVFDHLKLTDEDRNRATLYQQNHQREQLRNQSLSLTEFLAGLNLNIQIDEAKAEQISRASQLTERTNQFNFTTRRRNEVEMQQLWSGSQFKLLTVTVSDRFGDYGLVGLVIYEMTRQALKVDTFLLSCRVLGKGVEHRMLAHLGQIAHAQGCRWVQIEFIASARNKPAHDFLESVGADFQQGSDGRIHYEFPVEFAMRVAYKPAQAENSQSSAPPSHPDAMRPTGLRATSSQIGWIARNTHEPRAILQVIEAQLSTISRPQRSYKAPRTELEQNLCRIWEQVLRIERVGLSDDFFELGGSSLMAVQLLAQIRNRTGKSVPLPALFEAPTIEQLASLLEDKTGPSSALVALQTNGSKPPLVLIHGAGGGILWGYANLAPHLGAGQPVYAIQPHAATLETSNVEELATRYITQLRALQPAGPYYLGGYCFGGYLAYEMARQLRVGGEQVALLLLIEATAPNGSYEKVDWRRLGFISDFARNLSYWLNDFFDLTRQAQREFFFRQVGVVFKKLTARLRRRGERPIHLEQYVNISELPEHELNFWRMHLRAGADYVPQPYPGRVTLVRTRAQPLFCSYDPAYGWGELAGDGVEVRIVPGSHENIFKEPGVRLLAEPLRECLARAQKEQGA